jgi:hypothetical protein
MAATRAQVATSAGKTVELGFGSNTISVMIRANQSEAASGNVEYVPDENGDDCVAVVSNLGNRYTAEGALLANQTAPKKGDVLTLGSTTFLVEESTVTRTATVCRISMTLYANTANAWSTTP